jgi:hypothetical protein
MTTINELSEAQFKSLLDEYFAPASKRSKMTDAEIKDLARRLNEKINVPIINETGEEKILIKIVIKIDRFLYDHLPNEFYDLVRSLDKGIDDEEAKRLIIRLSKLANDKIDIPYLPESVEYLAIRFVIGVIINAARKQWDITKSKDLALQMNIPVERDVTDSEFDQMVA